MKTNTQLSWILIRTPGAPNNDPGPRGRHFCAHFDISKWFKRLTNVVCRPIFNSTLRKILRKFAFLPKAAFHAILRSVFAIFCIDLWRIWWKIGVFKPLGKSWPWHYSAELEISWPFFVSLSSTCLEQAWPLHNFEGVILEILFTSRGLSLVCG